MNRPCYCPNEARWCLGLYRRLEVQLPRFLMTSSSSLRDVLKQMAVTEVFQDGANLSGLTAEEGIQLSQVS